MNKRNRIETKVPIHESEGTSAHRGIADRRLGARCPRGRHSVVVPFDRHASGKRGWEGGASKPRSMHFDIVEAIRQKQQKQPKSIIISNGKLSSSPVNPRKR